MFKAKKKLVTILFAVVLVLSMSTTAFAEAPSTIGTQSEIGIQSIATVVVQFGRTSSTTAESTVLVDSYTTAEYIKTTATLQKYNYSTSTWSNVTSKTKTEYDTIDLYMANDWTLSSSITYRLKVVSQDKVDGVTSTVTFYSSSI